MDMNVLRQFRDDIYNCFQRSRDALFNTVDALMTETQAKSFPEVSQSLWFERKWPSLYEAFEDGRIDAQYLREIFARYLPQSDPGKWLWIGIDASKIARPEAVTSADRTAQRSRRPSAFRSSAKRQSYLNLFHPDGIADLSVQLLSRLQNFSRSSDRTA